MCITEKPKKEKKKKKSERERERTPGGETSKKRKRIEYYREDARGEANLHTSNTSVSV